MDFFSLFLFCRGRWWGDGLGFLGAWVLLKGGFVGVVSECSRGTLRREGGYWRLFQCLE